MIPNELIRRGLMRVNFTTRESRIFWTIVSFSWSWHHTYCFLTYRELSSYSAMSLVHTHETVQSLIDKNILRISKTKQKSKFILNQNVETWNVEFKKNAIQKEMETSGFFDN
ncbi:MAG: replication protein [Nitrospirae bacterium]|nr:replication protein [Nitrospirota bacterium]